MSNWFFAKRQIGRKCLHFRVPFFYRKYFFESKQFQNQICELALFSSTFKEIVDELCIIIKLGRFNR